MRKTHHVFINLKHTGIGIGILLVDLTLFFVEGGFGKLIQFECIGSNSLFYLKCKNYFHQNYNEFLLNVVIRQAFITFEMVVILNINTQVQCPDMEKLKFSVNSLDLPGDFINWFQYFQEFCK